MGRKSFQNALKSKEIHHRTRKKLKKFPPAAGKEKTNLKTLFYSTIVFLNRAEGAKNFGGCIQGVYRVWSDFGGIYRVDVYIGLKNPIFYPVEK